ncbi:hypothetical protein M438DRAFT_382987 [Aureobasidium pullulans EXF-150]|uniref:Uncharacterized protein n=1 Tax=Aureobasidium pullulans EXF-150 TaxID=1043002 RepID=A0A074XD84_AURPU|nr:uncharacterized protein M438DRAFT_382987 [Aureobasidium pullulans EXF-150]KEQ81644.1 hypothetical protein M438DRAFT_382987 [Aureobasidium pullulans EXF-150]
MEAYMPGRRWLAVPGSDKQSALYAVAAGLASRVDMERPLDWSEGTPEREILDYLRRLTTGPGSRLTGVMELSTIYMLESIIRTWNDTRQGGQYGLIVNDELLIGGRNYLHMLAGSTKLPDCTVVLRQGGRRWEVLAHFTDPRTTKIIIDELQKHSSTMLRTVEKLKEDLEKLPSPAPASLTATMEVLLAALKLAAVAEDKETTA